MCCLQADNFETVDKNFDIAYYSTKFLLMKHTKLVISAVCINKIDLDEQLSNWLMVSTKRFVNITKCVVGVII